MLRSDILFLPAAALALLAVLAILVVPVASAAGPAEFPHATPLLGIKVVRALPHDPGAFTQGLLLHDGLFYESLGHYGESELRVTDPETGRIKAYRTLADDLFGEGLALANGRIVQLTWKSGRALLWDARTLNRAGEISLGREAWGLAAGPDVLYLSDGSATILTLAPDTLAVTGSLDVHDQGALVMQLNELEYVNGYLLANVWFEDVIAAINPKTGLVAAWIDLSPLRPLLDSGRNAGVANGIAWDGSRLFVTGKNWDKVFVIDVPRAPWRTPAP